MIRTLSKTFLHGLVTIVPITLTLYILWWLGSGAEMGFGKLLQLGLPERFYVPGMGLCLGLLLVFVVGVVTRAWFVRQLLALAERLVQKVPLVGTIYGSIKDLRAGGGESEVAGPRGGPDESELEGTLTAVDPTARELTLTANSEAIALHVPAAVSITRDGKSVGFEQLLPATRVKCSFQHAGDVRKLARIQILP